MKTKKKSFPLLLMAIALFLFSGCSPTGTKEPEIVATTSTSVITHDTLSTCACDNSSRYPSLTSEGGTEISPSDGKDLVTTFQNNHPGIIKGGFISKIALDSIFCKNKNFNGLYCYIAEDGSGNQTMVIEGWRDEENSTSRVKVKFDNTIPSDQRYKVFKTELLCPTMCGYCGQ